MDKAHFVLTKRPIDFDEKTAQNLNSVSICILKQLTPLLADASWSAAELEASMRDFAANQDIGLGKIGMPLKAALSGRANAPSAFGMMAVLGRDESLARIKDVIENQ